MKQKEKESMVQVPARVKKETSIAIKDLSDQTELKRCEIIRRAIEIGLPVLRKKLKPLLVA